MFQFQYGAIKSYVNAQTGAGEEEFQFQYGAIKSRTQERPIALESSFNSNMVRLREVFWDNTETDPAVFQFQYGAIKS